MKDLQKKDDTDLVKLLNEKQQELREFRFGIAGSRTKNVKLGRTLRRDIAQIRTEMNTRTRKVAVSEPDE